jgi:hypothetical protein
VRLPADPQWQKLFDFVGYGRLDAPLWFLGMEESVNVLTDLEQSLAAREGFGTTQDLAEGQRVLGLPLDERRRLNLVWHFMAKLARCVVDLATDWDDTQLAAHYVRQRLGRRDGETLLGELLPLPKRGSSQWPPEYLRWYPSRVVYEEQVAPLRLARLQQLAAHHRPRLVVCYGKKHWKRWEQLWPGATWRHVPDAPKSQYTFVLDATQLAVRTPFLGNGQFADEDVGAIGRLYHQCFQSS